MKDPKPEKPEPEPSRRAFLGHSTSRRRFIGAVGAAAAGAVVVVKSDRPDPPERRLLALRVRWIGHC